MDCLECGCQTKLGQDHSHSIKDKRKNRAMDLFGLLFAIVLAVIIILTLREPIRRILRQAPWDLFVSHRSTDNRITIPIVNELRNRKLRVWIDLAEIDETKSQDSFRFPISVGIQRSSHVLIFTSEEYCKSDFCKEEAFFFIRRFAKQPERIIEIRLDENDARNILKIPARTDSIDLNEFGTFQSKQELYAALANEIIYRIRQKHSHSV
jgi:hypothetical protein